MTIRYAGDPRWITAKFNSKCHKCGLAIVKGGNVWYYPGPKYAMCDRQDCGKQAARNFNAAIQDEVFMRGDQYGFGY
jgi:hypothetical protein